MIRNHKALGLALAAMFAFSAFAVQSASAVPLTTETAHLPAGATVYLTGEQENGVHILKSTSEVKCSFAHFLAQTKETPSINELTVTPSYPTEKPGGGNNCTAFGFANTHITTNGCNYTFTTPTAVTKGEVTWHASQIHLVCPLEKKIDITPTSFGVSVCTQSIASQTPTEGHVIGRNAGGATNAMDVTLIITLKGIHYTGTGGPCGTAGTNAELTGESTVKCFKNEARTEQVGCTFS